jgi:O-antigen/teichoic acid export membrane protein
MRSDRSAAAAVRARAAQTFAARVFATLAAVATGDLIAHGFGPAGKGTYSAVQALIALPAGVSAGGASAISFSLLRERRSMRQLFPGIVLVFGGIAAIVTSGAVAYGVMSGWSAVTMTFAVVVPASIFSSARDSYYIAQGRMLRLNLLTIALPCAVLLGAGAAAILHLGMYAVLVAFAGSTFGCAAFLFADMMRAAQRWDARALPLTLTSFLRIGFPTGINSALGALNYRIDSYILMALLGLTPFGIYSIAVNAGDSLFLLSRSIAKAISKEIGASEAARAAELTACTVRTTAALTAICATVLFACAPDLVNRIFGMRFDSAALPLRLLVPGVVAFSSSPAFASYFIGNLGKPLAVTAINVTMIAAQAAACVLLVPHYGLAGAAVASTATYIFGAAANSWCFCRWSGMSPAAVWILRRRDIERLLERRT